MQAAAKPTVRTNDGTVSRSGKGYSLEELKEAGLSPRLARSSGIPVDMWRSTKYPENVEQLKSVARAEKTSKPAPKKQEGGGGEEEEKPAEKTISKKKAKKGKSK